MHKNYIMTPNQVASYEAILTSENFLKHYQDRQSRHNVLSYLGQLDAPFVGGVMVYHTETNVYRPHIVNDEGVMLVFSYEQDKLITAFKAKVPRIFAMYKSAGDKIPKPILNLMERLGKDSSMNIETARQYGYI